MQKTTIVLILVLSLTALVVGGVLHYTSKKTSTPLEHKIEGLLYPQVKEIYPFSLTDQNNQPFTLNDLQGKWSLMFFGYTQCPDICPITMQTLRDVYKHLEATQPDYLKETQFVFVSVDGNRDTPKKLKGYVEYFNRNFIGATGDERAVNRLTRQLGIVYIIVPAPDGNPDHYLIDHSSSITLIDPKGRMIGLFSAPHQAEDISQRYAQMRAYLQDKI